MEHLKARGVRNVVYKALPYIYHRQPAQEDLYALARLGARLARTDVTTTIDLSARGHMSSRRKRGMKKAASSGVHVGRTENWAGFWSLLSARLKERHGVEPVHSLDEIRLLAERFPQRITLTTAQLGEEILAGVVLYETDLVAHAQYIAASSSGLEVGALDLLFDTLITEATKRVRYFDFGISTEQQGRVLNEGLIAQKEGFGGSAVVHQVCELEL